VGEVSGYSVLFDIGRYLLYDIPEVILSVVGSHGVALRRLGTVITVEMLEEGVARYKVGKTITALRIRHLLNSFFDTFDTVVVIASMTLLGSQRFMASEARSVGLDKVDRLVVGFVVFSLIGAGDT
jgi:hypothetical protein